jgi:hypothetical protein
VRRGRKQQKMPRERGQQLTEAVALSVFHLVAEVRGAEFVRLVADDQIPVGLLKLGLKVFVAAQFVQPTNCQ